MERFPWEDIVRRCGGVKGTLGGGAVVLVKDVFIFGS